MTDEADRLARLRAIAARRKTRILSRDGGYMLFDSVRNTVVLGADPDSFSASLDQIAAWLATPAAAVAAEDPNPLSTTRNHQGQHFTDSGPRR